MDKHEQLFKAIDRPGELSDRELENLLGDKDIEETLRAAELTRAALTTVPAVDVEAEWKRFCETHIRRHRQRRWQYAAAVMAAAVSLTVVAAVVGFGGFSLTEIRTADSDSITATNNANTASGIKAPAETSPSQQIVIFEDKTLKQILNEVSAHYGCKVIVDTDKANSLRLYFRWDKTDSVAAVVSALNNFEQISIKLSDNAITAE